MPTELQGKEQVGELAVAVGHHRVRRVREGFEGPDHTHQDAQKKEYVPTLADIAGADIPTTWPGREPTPLAGVSLKPILDGKGMESRPPIHLLHHLDRGLRDGNWKLVSFRSKAWELYNLAEDRAETKNLAAKHPDILKRMAAEWHRMAKEEVLATEREQRPVSKEGPPHIHRQWTFSKKAKGGD